MKLENVEKAFEKIGAKVDIGGETRRRRVSQRGGVRIDIANRRDGERFDIAKEEGVTLEVLDVRPRLRHLLLMAKDGNGDNFKFLCGHDERHWFVAAVPDNISNRRRQGVTNVTTAMEALKPPQVLEAQQSVSMRHLKKNRRKNKAFKRQGEWFFLPVKHEMKVDKLHILKNEPFNRGNGSKSHYAEFAYNRGGVQVRVSHQYPNGVTEKEYQDLIEKQPDLTKLHWRIMRRDAVLFVRGNISHADHDTIYLDGWHEVVMNTEGQARGAQQVAFLD